MFRFSLATVLIATLGLAFGPAPAAHAGIEWKEGWWQAELATGFGLHSGRRSRSGDILVVGAVDYEIPASPRATLSLRAMPLFGYAQAERGEDSLWGAGFGLAGRFYQVKDEYRGWFAEVQAGVLGHDGNIDGNTASINFLTGAGVGYQFKNDWHTTLKFQHLSNAGLGESNAGANSIGLAVGFRF